MIGVGGRAGVGMSRGDVLGDRVSEGGNVVQQTDKVTCAVSRVATEGGADVRGEDGGGHVGRGREEDLCGRVAH